MLRERVREKNARSTHLEELEKNRLRGEEEGEKKILISARTKTKVPIRKL